MDREGDDSGEATTGSTFSLARVLRSLKRRGSNLLIVGIASDDAHGRVCRRMLGDDDAGPRRRVLVVTGDDREAVIDRAQRVERPPAETVTRISYTAGCRSAPVEEEPEPIDDGVENDEAPRKGTLPNEHRIEAGELPELAAAIEAAIDALEANNDGLQPAELRVCIDSLIPLLDGHDRSAVKGFLDRVTGRIEDAHGMGHVHLPVGRDWAAVAEFETSFDAVVELRDEPDGLRQRWRLIDSGIDSEWFDV